MTGTASSTEGADSFARDWQAVRDDPTIQFAAVEVPPAPETPGWWQAILDAWEAVSEFLAGLGRAIGMTAPLLPWVLGALALAVALLIVWRLRRDRAARGGPQAQDIAEPWQPEAGASLALLEEADRLAAEGRFDEAAHLLLTRSVQQIAAARPELLAPSSTAREIAALPALPDAARTAFATIAAQVERALFALRRLTPEDWRVARAAYAEFALAAGRPAA